MVRLYLNHYKIKPQSGSKYCRQIVTAATLLLYSWPNGANVTPPLSSDPFTPTALNQPKNCRLIRFVNIMLRTFL